MTTTPFKVVGGKDSFADDVTDRRPPDDEGGGGGGGGEAQGGDGFPPCPVEALGQLRGVYYFRSTKGEVHAVNDAKLFSRAGIARLFDGDTTWLRLKFPVFGKPPTNAQGETTGEAPVVGWHFNSAGEYLMRLCADKPLWDPQASRREGGVWIVGASSDPEAELLVHCGDVVGKVEADGSIVWMKPGFRKAGIIYEAVAPTVRPDFPIATVEEAATFAAGVNLWRFEEDHGGKLLVGAIAIGMLGQAVPWRPHLVIGAQPGSGKTKLAEWCDAATPTSVSFNNFSEAGLRHAVTRRACTILLDEGEGDIDERGRGPVERAIEFLRLLSGGSGSRSVRGGPGGEVQIFNATGSAILLAVLPPVLLPQDEQRFTRLILLPLDETADTDGVNAAIAAVAKLAPKLWARMIVGRGRYLANFAVIRKVMIDRLKCPPRQVDQPGSLLAAYATMMHDAVISEARAGQLVDEVRFAIKSGEQALEEGGPSRCWSYILSAQPDVWGGGTKRTTGQIIAGARRGDDDGKADRKHLESIGLKLHRDKAGKTHGIYVSNNASGLMKIFNGTRWAGGKWKDDLRFLTGAVKDCGVRIGGDKPRSVFLPAEPYLPTQELLDDIPDDAAPPRPPDGGRESAPGAEVPPKPPF